MTGRDHILIGAGTTALAVGMVQSATGGLDLTTVWPAVAAAAAGSLAPDLDHPWSLASATIPLTLISYAVAFLSLRAYEAAHPNMLLKLASSQGPEWVTGAWAAIAIGIALLVFAVLLGRAFGHRGIVHSLGFGAAACALAAALLFTMSAEVSLVIPFAWGWIAHLLADATTPAGLDYVLWPLVRESA